MKIVFVLNEETLNIQVNEANQNICLKLVLMFVLATATLNKDTGNKMEECVFSPSCLYFQRHGALRISSYPGFPVCFCHCFY